ncbi:MAG: hypothetical protein ABJD66_08890 [Cellulophaga sp.]|uniref:hypothetical protein n=1 Tax=Flavobacteriaceae TaxID=49546 RepID=UPI001B391DF3|nr:hypothetical protein [Maribacter sp. MMG018]MBQ4915581.1 hypothetical protein [Maribacter sp. MMG018]
MNKTIIFLLLTILTSSCTDINQTENTIARIESLQAENDSLKTILADINNKYVFDSISLRDIPNYKNTYKMNTDVQGEIVFVGYNRNKKTNVIIVDSISYNPKVLYNPDTLKMKKGGFQYKKKIDADRVYMKMLVETKNDYGKEYEGISSSAIQAKKN